MNKMILCFYMEYFDKFLFLSGFNISEQDYELADYMYKRYRVNRNHRDICNIWTLMAKK